MGITGNDKPHQRINFGQWYLKLASITMASSLAVLDSPSRLFSMEDTAEAAEKMCSKDHSRAILYKS